MPDILSCIFPYHAMGKLIIKILNVILGQGEAMDCFNLKLQDNAVLESQLNNDIKQQSIDIINAITDPTEKAAMYKKVFGDCCDVPQSGCNCVPPSKPA